MGNKIVYGLKKVCYFKWTESAEGVLTPGTPIEIPGMKTLTADPKGDQEKIYANNEIYYVSNSNEGYEGNIGTLALPEEFRTEHLGEYKNADGVLIETNDAAFNPFGLLFEFEGDEKAVRHCMPYCTASRPKQEGKTSEGKIDPQETEISYVGQQIPGTKIVKWSTGDGTTKAVYDAWFTKVSVPELTPPTGSGV